MSREIETLTRFGIHSTRDLQPYLDQYDVDLGEMPEFCTGMAAKRATRE